MLGSSNEVIKLFSCSTQLSTKFHLLIKAKIPTNEEVSCFKSLRCCIIILINVKMTTNIGIFTFMSRINFMLSGVEHEKSFITSGPVHQYCFGDKGRCQIYHKSIMPHVSKVFIFGTMGANAKGGGVL